MNLLNIINLLLDINCQIITKCAIIPEFKFFHQLNTIIEEGLFRNLQAAGSRVGRDVQIPAFVYCRTVLGTCPCVTLVVAKVLEEWGFFIYLFFVA